MHWGLACLLLLLSFAAHADTIVMPGLQEGRLAETDLNSGHFVLIVWASWSPHCRDIAQRVNQIAQTWKGKADVRTIVFQEEADTVRRFLQGQALQAPTFIDQTGAFSKKHAVTTLPSLLILKDGEAVFSGKLPTNPDSLIERSLR